MMHDVVSISGPAPETVRTERANAAGTPATQASTPAGRRDVSRIDDVELSPAAQALPAPAGADAALAARIERIKAQIADGTYLTEGKLEAVIDGLYAEMQHE